MELNIISYNGDVDMEESLLREMDVVIASIHNNIGYISGSEAENTNAIVETYNTFVLPDNLKTIMETAGKTDYMIDAVDTVAAKLAIAQFAHSQKISLISSMGTGNKFHGERFEITDISKTSVCPLCRVMRRELKKMGIEHLKVLYSKEPPASPILSAEEKDSRRIVPGSMSFVPPVAGLLIAGEVVRELIEIS